MPEVEKIYLLENNSTKFAAEDFIIDDTIYFSYNSERE